LGPLAVGAKDDRGGVREIDGQFGFIDSQRMRMNGTKKN